MSERAPRTRRAHGRGEDHRGPGCARRLGRPFVDTDELIMTRAAMTSRSSGATGGEERFRESEREVVVEVCASPEPLVIACGGGTVVDADNRRRLRDAGVVVWLRAPTAVFARAASGTTRAVHSSPATRRAARPAFRVPRRCLYRGGRLRRRDRRPRGRGRDRCRARGLRGDGVVNERVTVELGERSYDVVIEDSYEQLHPVVERVLRVAVVTQPNVDEHVGPLVRTVIETRPGEIRDVRHG